MRSKTLTDRGDEPRADQQLDRAFRFLRTQVAGLPQLARAGLVLFVAGVLIDLIGPVLGSGHSAHHPGSAHIGHLVALAGMAVILTGVVIDGARLQFRPQTADTQSKEPSDAIR